MLSRIMSCGIVVLVLGACCPFGYTTHEEYRWTNPQWSANEVSKVKSRCAAYSKDEQRQRENEFFRMVQQQCRSSEPFNNVQWVDVSGKPLSSNQAQKQRNYFRKLCQHSAAKSTEQRDEILANCPDCRRNMLESCYREQGLSRVATRVPACKSMRLF